VEIDATFLPLAVELIQDVFPTSIVYHRTDGKNYDPATGDVVDTVTDYFISAGVLSRNRTETGGIGETYSLALWLDHSATGLPHLPTTSDSITYDGTEWKVTDVNPTYSSKQLIASKILARNQ
jgi:hypothetical protein